MRRCWLWLSHQGQGVAPPGAPHVQVKLQEGEHLTPQFKEELNPAGLIPVLGAEGRLHVCGLRQVPHACTHKCHTLTRLRLGLLHAAGRVGECLLDSFPMQWTTIKAGCGCLRAAPS